MRSAWALDVTITTSASSGASKAATTVSPGFRPMTGLVFAVVMTSSLVSRFTTPLAVTSMIGGSAVGAAVSARSSPSGAVAGAVGAATNVSADSPFWVANASATATPRERPPTSEIAAAGETSARPALVIAITLLMVVV